MTLVTLATSYVGFAQVAGRYISGLFCGDGPEFF